MDALDLRILHTMGYTPWGYRPGSADALRPSAIAEHHDVTPETVSRRIDRMEAEGVIDHYEVYPNPAHLGLDAGAFGLCLDPGEPNPETLTRVQRVDGVVETIEFRGDVLAVGLAYASPTERDRRLDLITDLLGVDELIHLLDPPAPEPQDELSPLDWGIIEGLRGQADRPLAELADELGTSYRTVKRHRDRMIEEGSLFLVPWVQTAAVEGLIHFLLAAVPDTIGPEETVGRLRGTFTDRVQYAVAGLTDDVTYGAIATFAKTLADVEAMREQAEQLEGIDRALTFLPKRRTETDWIDEQIARKRRAVRAGGTG